MIEILENEGDIPATDQNIAKIAKRAAQELGNSKSSEINWN